MVEKLVLIEAVELHYQCRQVCNAGIHVNIIYKLYSVT